MDVGGKKYADINSGYRASIGRDTGPKICALLSHGSSDCGAFHLSLVVHGQKV